MTKKTLIACGIAIFLVLLLRTISLGSYDLNDTTEARYAGIAMRMVDNNDFITAYVEPDFPFLAKPPLSFWLTAASFKIFGINEFAARLPHFLLGVFLVGIIFIVFKRLYNSKNALILSAIILTNPSFVVMSGLVMTESTLIFCITVAMLSAWLRLEKDGDKFYSYLFFVSLGFAMLAKGPVGVVMTCAPLAIYLTIYRSWILFFKKFNIFSGALISMLIFLPWYILEEIENPGFLEYFIIGEHFGRFLMPGWKGDLYGHAHNEPLGRIISYFFLSTVPWVLYPIVSLVKNPASWLKNKPSRDVVFFSCFAFFPVAFFLFAHNIIIPYGFFSIIPFSILVFYFFKKNEIKYRLFAVTLFICPIALLCTMLLNYSYEIIDTSDKRFIKILHANNQKISLYYNSDLKYSSRFYSSDKIKLLQSEDELKQLSDNTFIIINIDAFNNISEPLRHNFKSIICDKVDRCLYEYHGIVMYK